MRAVRPNTERSCERAATGIFERKHAYALEAREARERAERRRDGRPCDKLITACAERITTTAVFLGQMGTYDEMHVHYEGRCS